jgi:hypothetical protein
MLTRLAVLALALTGWLAAADVAGKWKATFDLQDGPVEVIYEFKVEGATVTGSVTSSHGDGAVTDGKLEGDAISFAVERGDRKVQHKGAVTGNEMKLEVNLGERTVSITARRIPG